MKIFVTLFFVSISFISQVVFAQKKEASKMYNGQVQFAGNVASENGTVTVVATGFDKNITESKLNAFRAAFYNLMFRGIPGSKYSMPLIPDENDKKDNEVVKSILKDGYSSFVNSSSVVEEDKKSRKIDGVKGFQSSIQITINVDALRRYLESKEVIRKFGF